MRTLATTWTCIAIIAAVAVTLGFVALAPGHAYADETNASVAIVDTGVADDVPVAERASVLCDDGADESGHGTEMARVILGVNPDAKIISVKAFSNSGKANLLMAYAGMLKAITYSPGIIVTSFTTHAPAGDPVMEALIAKAQAQGITVVAAAGNQGENASDYSPANSSAAVTVGALGPDGNPLGISNKGDAVNAWEIASSTSYAAAIHAGKLTLASGDAAEGVTPGIACYGITFNANGGTGHMIDMTARQGGYELPGCGFARPGKKFAGWNTQPDGKGRFVPDRQAIEGTRFAYDYHGLYVEADLADCIEDGQLVLYAQWERPSVMPESIYEVQWWWDNKDGTWLFQNKANGEYMTRAGAANGKNVNTAAFTSTNNRATQQWAITTPESYDVYKIAAANSTGYVLDVEGGSTESGANIRMWASNSTISQRFYGDPSSEGDASRQSDDPMSWFSQLEDKFDVSGVEGSWIVLEVNGAAHNVQTAWQLGKSDRYSGTATAHTSGVDTHGSKTKRRQWKAIRATYTVRYNGNGSTSGSMSNQTHYIDKSQALTTNAFSKTGYYFNGWNTKADGSGTSYADKKSVKNLAVQHGATVNLYAQWKPYKMTVKYHANGGTIADAPYLNGTTYYKLASSIVNKSSSKNDGYTALTATVTAADTYKNLHNVVGTAKITQTGYHVESTAKYFYITKSDGTKVYFNADNTADSTTNAVTTKRLNLGTQITSDKTVTLRVNWIANTYTVVYVGNGATEGETDASSHTYNVASELTANGYVRTGYRFTGWNTAADGSGTAYSDGQSVKNLTAVNNGTVTLYAQWEPATIVELYVDDFEEPWQTMPAIPSPDGTWAVPAELTAEAQREGCTHADGTPGLEAWFNDEEFKERYEPRALEPGVVRLYARNWATVSYRHAGDIDPSRTYAAPDGTTGTVAVASKAPVDIESPVGTVVSLGEVGNGRLSYDAGGAFPLTAVARPGWYADEEGTTAPFTTMAISADIRVYKIWDASNYDGYVGQRS